MINWIKRTVKSIYAYFAWRKERNELKHYINDKDAIKNELDRVLNNSMNKKGNKD